MTDIKNLHKNEILVAEASKLKVIDTVFTKTVASVVTKSRISSADVFLSIIENVLNSRPKRHL